LLLFLIVIIGVLNKKLMSNTYKIKGKSINTGNLEFWRKEENQLDFFYC
jgi:uncharacterized protein YcnI